MLLGCIGDDFTGSSDLANTLAKGGMATTQYVGIPEVPAAAAVEAGVISLKTRTLPAKEAVRQSLGALEWLQAAGCTQFFFKYCSTFDSTPAGNIGPVIEALAQKLDAGPVIVCPAFPATGRSLYQGHLFVGDRLLNESGMEAHPLTPMTDPDIRRWLSRQTALGIGHVGMHTVLAGVEAIGAALDAEVKAGRPLVIVDAIHDADLLEIGEAAATYRLITGGSGIALGLPGNFRDAGLLSPQSDQWAPAPGPGAILSGSCSKATRAQVAAWEGPRLEITAKEVIEGTVTGATLSQWARAQDGTALIYSSADPETVRAAQETYGTAKIAGLIEETMAETARALVDAGVSRLVIAGGETSGAVVEALDLSAFAIGPEIAPGVPALRAEGRALALALKSGNFGDAHFFSKALETLGQGTGLSHA